MHLSTMGGAFGFGVDDTRFSDRNALRCMYVAKEAFHSKMDHCSTDDLRST